MITVKNWGPAGIADIAARAVRIAYRRLRRADCMGEAARLRYWFGDDYRRDIAELIVGNLHSTATTSAPARRIMRELSTIVMRRHLQAEINLRVKQDGMKVVLQTGSNNKAKAALMAT